jgi:DNA-binding LacI/PurR family transcriptional regulator
MEQPSQDRSSTRRGTPRVSMHDVAARAGVTQKTVSRVVNGERHVATATRERVLAAIRELGFRPNAAARALVTRQSRRLGMVTMGSALYGPASVLDGVEHAARSAGYALSVMRTCENSAEELQRAVDQLVDQGAEGIVISEPMDLGHPQFDVPAGVTVLSLDHPAAHHRPDELVVGTDEPAAARSATEHLLALGHRTVWHIAGPENWASSRHRIAGWRTALADADAAEPDVLRGDWTPRSGFEAMRSLLLRPDVTAVFAANDQMAAGAMSAVRETGLRIPDDVSIVGFDDDPVSAFLHPPLTTIRQDFPEVTRLAVHRLIRTLEGHPPPERQRSVPAQLTVRSSTGRPNPTRAPLRPTQNPTSPSSG